MHFNADRMSMAQSSGLQNTYQKYRKQVQAQTKILKSDQIAKTAKIIPKKLIITLEESKTRLSKRQSETTEDAPLSQEMERQYHPHPSLSPSTRKKAYQQPKQSENGAKMIQVYA